MPLPADPFTAAFSSLAGGLGKGLGDAIGGGGGPFIGGSSAANSFGTTMDGSGWVVNIQGRQDATQNLQRTSSVTPNLNDPTPQYVSAPSAPVLAGMSGVSALLMLGIVAGFVVFARKRKG